MFKDSKKIRKETINVIRNLEIELKKAEQEIKENHNSFLKIAAEFENYKKRSSREVNEFKKFSNESLIKEMLIIADNLELALNSSQINKPVNSDLMEGVAMTLKGLLNIFSKFNVKPIESLGKIFDPAFHQAIMQEETNKFPENIVVKETQRGYMMYDRLIRPAMVVVSTLKG